VNDSYLSSVRIITPNSLLIDSFTYNDQNKVARFEQIATDGTDTATVTVDFHFSGSNPLPDTYSANLNGSSVEPHQLTYDGQGGITKETSTGGSHLVTYYSYSGNYVICKVLFDGTVNNAQFDTLVVTGGNITGEKVWNVDNGSVEKQGDLILGHATAANPGYKAEVANSVGPLLYVLSIYNFGGYGDYISKGVMNKIGGVAEGLPPGGYSYNVSTDAKGRVSTLTPVGAGVPAGVKTVFNYY